MGKIEIRKFIRTNIRKYLNEDSVYIKRKNLKKWRDEELNKLKYTTDSKKNIFINYQREKIEKTYNEKEKELLSKENPYGHSGNINVSFIYHYTTGENLIGIINYNTLFPGAVNTVSFTTSGNLYKSGFTFWGGDDYRGDGNVGVKIKFNFKLMKDDGIKFYVDGLHDSKKPGEFELRTHDEIDNIKKYIIGIFIFKDKEENFIELTNFLNQRKIKYIIVNPDKPIYKEKENELLHQETLLRYKKIMELEIKRIKRLYYLLSGKMDNETLKTIKNQMNMISNDINTSISMFFSYDQKGHNYFSPISNEEIKDDFEKINPELYNEIIYYNDLIKKIGNSTDNILKLIKNKISEIK
jgi:hypothetical protein